MKCFKNDWICKWGMLLMLMLLPLLLLLLPVPCKWDRQLAEWWGWGRQKRCKWGVDLIGLGLCKWGGAACCLEDADHSLPVDTELFSIEFNSERGDFFLLVCKCGVLPPDLFDWIAYSKVIIEWPFAVCKWVSLLFFRNMNYVNQVLPILFLCFWFWRLFFLQGGGRELIFCWWMWFSNKRILWKCAYKYGNWRQLIHAD